MGIINTEMDAAGSESTVDQFTESTSSPHVKVIDQKFAAIANKEMGRRSALKIALAGTVAAVGGEIILPREAHASFGMGEGEFNQTDNLASWNQNEGEWGKKTWDLAGGWTMASAGCAIFAGAFLLRKAGIEGKGFTPINLLEEGKSKGWNGSYVGAGGMATWGNLGNGQFQYDGYDELGSSGKAMEEDIKKRHDEGYFLILHVKAAAAPVNGNVGIPNHYIAMDTVLDDGSIQVFDSGLYTLKFEEGYTNSGGSLFGIHKYKKEGLKPQDAPDINGGESQGGGESKPKGEEGAKDGKEESPDAAKNQVLGEAKPYPDEADLVGLGKVDYMAGEQSIQTAMASPVKGNKDMMALNELQENIDATQEVERGGWIRTSFSVVGAVMMMAGILWAVLGSLDMALNTNIIETVTKGKRKYSSVKDIDEKASGWGGLMLFSIGLLLFGALIYAGTATGFVYDITRFFSDFFDGGVTR